LLNRLKEKEEKIQQVLEELREEATQGTPIVVEGKNDVETLHALGLEGTIITVKTGGKSFLDIITELEQSKISEVILLLDFDRRGKQGTNRLRHNLEHVGVRVNLEFWRALLRLVGKDVQCIEGLTAYMITLRSKIGVASQQSKP
jgi:2,5-diamino-6-(ribosylamino)-4(3H)-pyrimidinone 5'-phosphate reductase